MKALEYKNLSCKCGGKSFFIKPVSIHIGLYCAACGQWQKWLSKSEREGFENPINYNK